MKPFFGLVLENNFGEVSINKIIAGDTYEGAPSMQLVGPVLSVSSDVGSDDFGNSSFISAVMGTITGEDLTGEGNYLGAVIGCYNLTGTNGSVLPTGAVLGLIMSEVTVADGAFVAIIDGDAGVTKANAAFKAKMINSNAGSGFDYGLDLYDAAFGPFDPLAILKADLRLSNQVCVFSGATAPVDGTTGDNFAGPGSIYIALDTGMAYQQTGLITNPVWKAMANAAVPSTVTGALLTGLAAGANTPISATDSILVALANLQAQIDALP